MLLKLSIFFAYIGLLHLISLSLLSLSLSLSLFSSLLSPLPSPLLSPPSLSLTGHTFSVQPINRSVQSSSAPGYGGYGQTPRTKGCQWIQLSQSRYMYIQLQVYYKYICIYVCYEYTVEPLYKGHIAWDHYFGP